MKVILSMNMMKKYTVLIILSVLFTSCSVYKKTTYINKIKKSGGEIEKIAYLGSVSPTSDIFETNNEIICNLEKTYLFFYKKEDTEFIRSFYPYEFNMEIINSQKMEINRLSRVNLFEGTYNNKKYYTYEVNDGYHHYYIFFRTDDTINDPEHYEIQQRTWIIYMLNEEKIR